MPGTLLSYQGIQGASAKLALSRGYDADRSKFVIPAKNFPAFKVRLPAGVELGGEGSSDAADLSVIRGSTTIPALELRDAISWEGLVLLGEVSGEPGAEEEWTLATRRYVVGVETLERDEVRDQAMLQLTLADQRFFWSRGLMRRWFFNWKDASDNLRPDSLKARDQPWTLAEIVRDEIVARLFRNTRLSAYPSEWDTIFPSKMEFPPFCSALVALKRIVQDYGLVEPCLRWDDSVALYLPGQGKVGYATGSLGGAIPSGPNVVDEFLRYQLDEEGTGQGTASEPGYPETFFSVVGGQRVATVAVDECEPIVVFGQKGFEKAYPLNEALVRKLTKAKYGLDWLRQWVLAPEAYKTNLDEAVSELFRVQAFRWFRLPGVVDAEGRIGPNAHLLPLLARAETSSGKRLPITVETYRFHSYHVAFWNNQASLNAQVEAQNLAKLRAEIDDLREKIDREKRVLSNFRQTPDPFNEPAPPLWDFIFRDGKSVLNNNDANLTDTDRIAFVAAQTNFVRADELALLARFAKQVQRLKDSSEFSRFAAQYEQHLLAKFKAEDELSGGQQVELYAIAKESIAIYEDAIKGRLALGDYPPEVAAKILALQERIRDVSGKLERAARDRQNKIAGGERPSDLQPQYQVVYRNLPRQVDPEAQVVNAQEGWFRTSALALHLTRDRVADAKFGGPGLLCPVRIIFGAVVRPRANVVQGTQSQKTQDEGAAELQFIEDLKKAEGKPSGFSATEQLVSLITGGDSKPETTKPSSALPEVSPARKRALLQVSGEITDNVVCPGGQTFVPDVLTDEESFYVACLVREGNGVKLIERDPKTGEFPDFRWDLAVRLGHPELVELVKLDGTTNRDSLDETAKQLALAQARRPDVVTTTRHKLARPLPFQPDGLIESVETESLEDDEGGPCGFMTTVRSGSSSIFRPGGSGSASRIPSPPRELDGLGRTGSVA